MVTGGKSSGLHWEFGTDKYTLLDKDLLYSTGNAAQHSVPKWEKNVKKNRYMYN